MSNKTSKLLIKTFVKSALKDSDESPERCTRNLVDMALHFSNGRFQQSFFEIARTMLDNENSPYYPLIEDTLKHVDKERLIDFGMALGYNGCTMGAHMIRKIKRTENVNVPWFLSLEIPESCTDVVSRYQPIIDQGKELGIYIYFLYTDSLIVTNLIPLIKNNPDCAVILICPSDSVTEDFAEAISPLYNLLIGVQLDDHTDTACLVLRDHRLLYSVCYTVSETKSSDVLSGSYFRFAEDMHCIFSAVVPDPTCSQQTRKAIYDAVLKSRNEQLYRSVPMDLIDDAILVGNIISPPTALLRFNYDGDLRVPDRSISSTKLNLFKQPLKEILSKAII